MARKRGSVDDSDSDDYDAEMDRGRTKKVRKAITAPSVDSSQVLVLKNSEKFWSNFLNLQL
jgi:hypothetical protein